MLAVKLIIEGLGLGFLLYLICAIGIRNGAVGMVFLYDQKVQDRVVELGLTTREDLRPYITAKDKKQKWIMGTAGMAIVAALLSAVMTLIL